jgi:predicted nucleic acid-binding protein
MILYIGTSSLAKLYVDEKYSDVIREWIKEVEIVVTCRVAYTEMVSALELRLQQNDLSKSDYDRIIKRFSRDWVNIATVDFDEREAGFFVKKYRLKRFDAIHLSSATLLKKKLKDVSLLFSSINEKLCKAASEEGLKVLTFI